MFPYLVRNTSDDSAKEVNEDEDDDDEEDLKYEEEDFEGESQELLEEILKLPDQLQVASHNCKHSSSRNIVVR